MFLELRIVSSSEDAQQRILAHYPGSKPQGPRDVALLGHSSTLEPLLGTTFSIENGSYKNLSPVSIPESLKSDIVGFIGLENIGCLCCKGLRANALPNTAISGINIFNGAQMAALYGFPPANVSGITQKIGIIQLGGSFSQQDLNYYFSSQGLGISPSIAVVLVDGATQTLDDASVEVALDVQIIAAVCPDAKITIYFAPNTMAGFYNAIERAGLNNDVVSISWGMDETDFLQRGNYTATFQSLISGLKKPIFIASGDRGSTGDTGTGLHVSFPASIPSAISCGGTTVTVSGGVISSEVAWQGSGGGYSAYYSLPDYQKGIVNNAMRGVPDVSANADPNTGYYVYLSNKGMMRVGGTSAVAPLWSALAARINQISSGSLIGPNKLYRQMSAFRDVSLGSNGHWTCNAGWDPVTGLGVPMGVALANQLAPTPVPPVASTPVPPVAPTPVPPVTPTPVPPVTPTPDPPVAPTPVFIGCSPTRVSRSSNQKINIVGKFLQQVLSVTIQGVSTKIISKTPTLIVCRVTGLLKRGPANLVLQTNGETLIVVNKKLSVF